MTRKVQVASLPLEATTQGSDEQATKKNRRRSRVFKAVNDKYGFDGWARTWLSCLWFVAAIVMVSYRYPATAGTFHSRIKACMTAYDTPDGNTADVRSQINFKDSLTHALGFLTVFADKATALNHPEGLFPITDYDNIMFARLEVDLKSNCRTAYKRLGLACYQSAVNISTGEKLDEATVKRLAGDQGFRTIDIFNPGVTRAELKARVQQVLDEELLFFSTYAFRARLLFGAVNEIAEGYHTVYFYTISRKSNAAIGSQAMREVVTLIENLDVRNMPFYITSDDYRRIVLELISLGFLLKAIWDEVMQFSMCSAWRNLYLSEEKRLVKGSGSKRAARVIWFYYAQPWNILDFLAIVNFLAWWILYAYLLVKSFQSEVKRLETLEHFDAVQSLADLQLHHLVWGIFTALLVGIRVLMHFKTHAGLSIFSLTLKLSWHRLKDLVMFFGYVYFLMTVLISPLFELTGANTMFRDTGTSLLNVALMTFQYMGFYDFFAYNAPTFGKYWIIFMFFFAVIVCMSVVICQNVLLALVAGAYEEAREAVGDVEFTEIRLSLYRLWWIAYSSWHCWLLRKSAYTLAEELIQATRLPDVWFYQHVFVRWALANLPEMSVLTQLYTDPASEILYMYSPWAWHRSSPWDTAQQAPWDEQLCYPMYSWADVPVNESGVIPRLRRMPPLFTRNPADGSASAQGRLPIAYSEADDLFAMSEEEVDEVLECAQWCWNRMQRSRLVARFAGMNWSERGHKLLREGLLEVYRRHRVRETTTSCVSDEGPCGESSSGALVAVTKPAMPTANTSGNPSTVTGGSNDNSGAGKDGEAPAAACRDEPDATTATMARARRFSLFSSRGRIVETLEMLWAEVFGHKQQQIKMKNEVRQELDKVRQELAEIKMLLLSLQLPQHQQQRGMIAAGAGAVGPGSTASHSGGNGSLMRGAAALPSAERPASGVVAVKSRGPWDWGE
ncbi:hypothetical protein VaNZ11_015366 [Volvox africanus]|uniref:Polycystin cation channel PKD1/PKD2 domain-containing protein n=1 Tax=Volvox africanus TaxID=51714 RepID=A0ABQ5SLE1_9CHLO|nr:hypothetical protein VaNZ11_015366 [Volvox africanus]